MSEKIKVVVADDSPFVCRLLTSTLQSSPEMEVVATALNGARAVTAVRDYRPDAVTLDLEMPGMNGLEALQRIMEEWPTPVVVVSGVSGRSATMTLQALDFGAVDFVLKYSPGVDVDPADLRREIVAKVRTAAGIRVVRSLRASAPENGVEIAKLLDRTAAPAPRPVAAGSLPRDGRVVVIGASTGGPVALCELLASLPASFPYAVLVVQHIPPSFTGVLASQLRRHSPLEVREAEDGELLSPGKVRVAPGGFHLLLGVDGRFEVRPGPEIGGHCPSIDVTMQSVAQVYGSRVSGVLLTGMGADGTAGLLTIHAKGGSTFVQDEASSVVYGMPQRALDQGVVDHVAPPREIAQMLSMAGAGSRGDGDSTGGADVC